MPLGVSLLIVELQLQDDESDDFDRNFARDGIFLPSPPPDCGCCEYHHDSHSEGHFFMGIAYKPSTCTSKQASLKFGSSKEPKYSFPSQGGRLFHAL